MARPKRTTRKAAEKTTQTASKNTTTAETTTTETATNEPVAIKPMVPRTAPLAALAATTATPSPVTTSQEVVIQFGGKEISGNAIAEQAKQAYKDAGNTDTVTSVVTYVKPEENKVYFVINDTYQGAFDL